MSRELLSRKEAAAGGSVRYFTGKECKRGHIAERYVSTRQCVDCVLEAKKRWDAKNPDKVSASTRRRYRENREAELAANKRWREENPERNRRRLKRWRRENLEHVRTFDREYYRANQRRIAQRKKRRYDEDPESFRERAREFARANPEIRAATQRRRRARKKNASGDHTAGDVQRLYEEQHGACAACSTSLEDGYHVDHIMPLALGGSNGSENLQLLCPPCNLSKGAKHPDEWNGREDADE